MNIVIAALLLLAGIVNLAPISGLLGAERLHALYGVDASDPQLAILLRHRALLFGIIGALLIAAVFRPELRVAASVAGLTSMLGFIAIARLVGGAGAPFERIVVADWVGSAALAAALVLARVERG